jgi:hypothetical protein
MTSELLIAYRDGPSLPWRYQEAMTEHNLRSNRPAGSCTSTYICLGLWAHELMLAMKISLDQTVLKA